MSKLENKIALVTGGSRGIGRAIALKLAQNGASVIVNYSSNEDEAKKTVEMMGNYKNNATIMRFDVSNEEQVLSSVEEIKKNKGTIDILVNNAGISIDGLFMRLKMADFDKQIAVNLKSAFLLSKSVIRDMVKKRAGRIINITSVVGQMGNVGQSVYSASKAGLIGLTKSLAQEFASRNILVNAIAPGYVETDMTKDILGKIGEEALKGIPLKRVGKPEEIAGAALFLASDDSSYITGQVLSVNGGLYI